MKINEILKKCNVSYYVQSIKNFDIKGISFDSKTIKENFIFAVVKGFKDDGEKYIKDLKKFKNIGIVVREGFKTKKDHQNLLIIRTKNVRELAGEIASLIYPNTINEKIAITGTNGKTSISHYIAEISSNQKISNCIFGTLGMGFLGTKYKKKNLLCILYALRAVSICVFIFSPPSLLNSIIFGITFGLLWLSTVPPTNGIVAQIFGTKYLSTLFGIVFLCHQFGAFAGAFLGGYFYDLYGSYDYAWYMAIALSIFATIVHYPINEDRLVRVNKSI